MFASAEVVFGIVIVTLVEPEFSEVLAEELPPPTHRRRLSHMKAEVPEQGVIILL